MTNFESVKKFMQTFGQEVKIKASFPSEKIVSLRIDLINEELTELKQAVQKQDLKEVADALTDILYVTYGAGHAFGIDLDKCFDEVQNYKLIKIGKKGKPIINEKELTSIKDSELSCKQISTLIPINDDNFKLEEGLKNLCQEACLLYTSPSPRD